MTELIDVIEAEPLGDHRLRVRFEDGLEGEIDFATESFDGVFAPLADPGYFAQVRIAGGTIAWPNRADVAPDTLHGWIAEGLRSVPLAPGL